jgi:hypothetical protein
LPSSPLGLSGGSGVLEKTLFRRYSSSDIACSEDCIAPLFVLS